MWVVSPAEKAKEDEIFLETDEDMHEFVSGLEVCEIFLETGIASTGLAYLWVLCGPGKLSKDMFALAFHSVNKKIIKCIDHFPIFIPEMLPPSDRVYLEKSILGSSPATDSSTVKELETLNNDTIDLKRDKSNVQEDLKE